MQIYNNNTKNAIMLHVLTNFKAQSNPLNKKITSKNGFL